MNESEEQWTRKMVEFELALEELEEQLDEASSEKEILRIQTRILWLQTKQQLYIQEDTRYQLTIIKEYVRKTALS